jgi:carboxyl-terminal processing protease
MGITGTAVVMEYIFGGCNALDEYSNFLTPDRYNDLFGSIQGELVGIGIEMKADKGRGMHLVNVLLDSPAERGGLLPDDYITAIDGRDCRDMTTDEAARFLRGTSGSRVTLTWDTPVGTQRSGEFVRQRVQIRSITRTMLLDPEQGIGYIRMEGFQDNTAAELDEALRSLERQGMRALIWDLRGNPGGLLETAAEVIDRFIDRGVLVSTRGRSPEQNQVFNAHGGPARSYPLALVVDENSASASEIVAGAIKDHRRGTIVGRTTYGKWSVQTIIHLPGETGLKLTTAKFYSPDNRNYSDTGLAPDVAVPEPTGLRTTFYRSRTVDEISSDPDVAEALRVLQLRLTRN